MQPVLHTQRERTHGRPVRTRLPPNRHRAASRHGSWFCGHLGNNAWREKREDEVRKKGIRKREKARRKEGGGERRALRMAGLGD